MATDADARADVDRPAVVEVTAAARPSGLLAFPLGRQRRPALWTAVGVLVVLGAACAFAPLLTDLDPLATDIAARNLPPGSEGHVLGTDTLGRDLFTRLLYGGRTSLTVGLAAAAVTVLLGVALGVAAQGLRWVDTVVTRVADTLLSLPLLVVVLALAAVLGGSLAMVILAIGVTAWMPVALVARAELRSQRQLRYVRAARAMGLSPWQVLTRHSLPGALPPIASIAAFEVGHAILTESTLSFLGLGVPPNRPAWGSLLEGAQAHLLTGQWYTVAFPAAAIVVTILAVNVIASAIDAGEGRAW
jgi:peptide/nickel transport system permease protein